MNILFFCQDNYRVDQIVFSIRHQWPGLKSYSAPTVDAGIQILEFDPHDLVIVCEDMPEKSMCSIIGEIRAFSEVPIVAMTQRDDEMELVRVFESGADDFIRLPCNSMELMARVVALMRRFGRTLGSIDEQTVQCGALLINPVKFECYLGPSRLSLTPTEFSLLYILAKNKYVTLRSDFIESVILGEDAQSNQALKKHIHRLRRKLGDDLRNPTWIKSVYGDGYRFTPPNCESDHESEQTL